MEYEWINIKGEILSPSSKAKKDLKVPSHWDFYVDELHELTETKELKNVSKPVAYIAEKIYNKTQIEYLLELINEVKKRDEHNQIDWKNTNQIVAKKILYLDFEQTKIAKEIDKKHGYRKNEAVPMNKDMKRIVEKYSAFEVWVKDKLPS